MKILVHATPENDKTILDLLESQGISLPCNCHGTNACGGKQYEFPCHMIPKENLTVSLPEQIELNGLAFHRDCNKSKLPDSVFIDLGTTTVAMIYYHAKSKTIFHTFTFANPQIQYGTDVISRIKYDVKFSNQYTLKNAICNKLIECHNQLTTSFSSLSIQTCAIGGNTTMIHLLLGYSLKGMMASPFTPYCENPNLYHKYADTNVFILPWISAFIGGDIVSGLLYLNFDIRKDTCLLADLGTNGELALCHNGKIYVTSTAAGPALEGHGLSCGCPAIPGAISDVTLTSMFPKTQTIENKLPTGICGSGAVSLLAELIRTRHLTDTGIITEKFPDSGIQLARQLNGTEIRFTRKDVRQIQLAVAAISAGIDTLCQKAELLPGDIHHLYLAGGLGYHININKVLCTGLFSNVPKERITAVGNTCLLGLEKVFDDMDISSRLDFLKSITTEIQLAGDICFEENFIRHLTYLPVE